MTSPPAGRQRLIKLGLLALICALPFLVTIIYLERHVDSIDTLPVDEYKDLVWGPDGRSLLLLHRPLTEGASTEVWSGDGNGPFEQLGKLSADKPWRLTGQAVDDAAVLSTSDQGGAKLALFEKGATKTLEIAPEWTSLTSQGKGLFFSKQINDVAFDQMVEVEDAPEVSRAEPAAGDPTPEASPAAPTRPGVQIGRFNKETSAVDPVFTIPYSSPKELPKVLLVRESPDKRFLALVTQFGDAGAGLWVYDSEASRLLWTRVVVDADLHGVDWSSSSVGLALTDGQGVVVLDNVLNIESTRYEAKGLGAIKPLYADDNQLYLVGESSLHRLDRQAGQIEVVFDSHSRGLDAGSFVVDPEATRAAFLASPKGYLELMVYDLSTKDAPPKVSDLPGSLRRAAQGKLTYQVGNALRTSWQFWVN